MSANHHSCLSVQQHFVAVLTAVLGQMCNNLTLHKSSIGDCENIVREIIMLSMRLSC